MNICLIHALRPSWAMLLFGNSVHAHVKLSHERGMTMKRKLITCVLLVLLLGFAWANGGKEDKPAEDVGFAGRTVTLKIGFLAGHVDPTEYMGVFQEKYPNISFEIMPIAAADWPEYITTLQTMFVSGTAPDVYHIPIEGIRRLGPSPSAASSSWSHRT